MGRHGLQEDRYIVLYHMLLLHRYVMHNVLFCMLLLHRYVVHVIVTSLCHAALHCNRALHYIVIIIFLHRYIVLVIIILLYRYIALYCVAITHRPMPPSQELRGEARSSKALFIILFIYIIYNVMLCYVNIVMSQRSMPPSTREVGSSNALLLCYVTLRYIKINGTMSYHIISYLRTAWCRRAPL